MPDREKITLSGPRNRRHLGGKVDMGNRCIE